MALLKADYINHILDSTGETLDTMMDLKLLRYGSLGVKSTTFDGNQEITSIIGLMGKNDFMIRLIMKSPVTVAIRICSEFLGETLEELNMDVIDAMKEIVNIIAGAAAAKMSENNFLLTLPVVLLGSKVSYSGAKSSSVFIPLFVPECGRLKLGLTANE